MLRLALIPAVLALLAVPGLSQEKRELPAPPKPPKWLKEELGDKLPLPPAAAEEVEPKEAVPEVEPPRGRRPVRVRINTPWIRLNLGFNQGGPQSKAVEVDVNVAGKRMGAPHPDAWRYRHHNGRWWYWLPKKRWAVWDNNRWVEVTAEMLRSGELRLGTPHRGNVRVKVGDLPGLNVGF